MYFMWQGSRTHGPDAPRFQAKGPLCPISIQGSPVTLQKIRMALRLILIISSGSKQKEPRYTRLGEAKVSHSQRMWAEVSMLHVSYSVNCLTAPLDENVSSGFYVQSEGQKQPWIVFC